MNDRPTLPLIEDQKGEHACGCGGACGSDHDHEHAHHSHTSTHLEENDDMSTQTFNVTGLTCGHCVNAVTDEVKHIPGVSQVSVDLVAGGTSTVRVVAEQPVQDADIAAALDEAGDYALSSS